MLEVLKTKLSNLEIKTKTPKNQILEKNHVFSKILEFVIFFPKLVKNLEFEVLKLIFEKVGNIFGSFEMVKKGKDGI